MKHAVERDPETYDVMVDAEAAFEAAADAIEAGEVIVLPTDTVYGVAADPFDPEAVQRLLDAKQRGRDMPPPVLVAEVEMVASLLAERDERVESLGRAFWPGALTIIGRAADSLRMDLGERGNTIAVRVPDHEFTRELLRRTGPLAVTSANLTGRPAALTIDEAVDQLGSAVSVFLDAGTMSGPTPSTIIDLSGSEPELLRAGRLSVEQINDAVPGLLPMPEAQTGEEASETPLEPAEPIDGEHEPASAPETASPEAPDQHD